MKSLYLDKPGEVAFTTLPDIEKIAEDEVKLRVIYGGICGSDVGVFKGKLPHASYPVVPGHEILGEVVAVGSHTSIELGKRAVVQPNSFCGECEYCQAGNTNICPEKKSLGINENGGFQNEFIVKEKYVIEVPDALSNERAVLVEPLAVIVHALEKVSIGPGTSVAVIGCGTEGMLAVALASYFGAKITAIDINPEKLDKVKEHYPDITTLHPEEVHCNQFEIVVEVAGVRASFEQCLDIAKPGGAVISVGFPNIAEIEVVRMVRKELTIYGSIIYNVPDDFYTSIYYLMDDKFYVEPIISEILPVTAFEEAYEKACSGKYRKIVLDFNNF
ncbi:alcohol dehydrogenase catalytic domain-containing protein [Virgibacillus sp. YIM 98842]|uniref:zinc-dependent alcohol dehydrogenase n=1 Tax=Virgibacillus sp. YIM 98842 TaxID=2663533 RepID=UPI0013DBF501|nr:alcohol dehydrogenase catalytic domain-containing protein [Virgibacillus sp. YIM 98842]